MDAYAGVGVWAAQFLVLNWGLCPADARGGGGKGGAGGGRGGGARGGAGGAALLMSSGGGLGGGAIALIVLGSLGAVAAVTSICCCCKRFKKKNKAEEAANAVLDGSRNPSPYPTEGVELMDNSSDPNVVNVPSVANKCPYKNECIMLLSVLHYKEDGTMIDTFNNENLDKTSDIPSTSMQKILNPFARSPLLNDPHLVLAMASTPEYQKFFKDTLQNIPEAEKVADSRTVILLYGARCCQNRAREVGVDTMVRTILDIERTQFDEHLYQDLPPGEVIVRGTHLNLLIPGAEDLDLDKIEEELYYEPPTGGIHSPLYLILHFYLNDHGIAGPQDQRNTLVCIVDM